MQDGISGRTDRRVFAAPVGGLAAFAVANIGGVVAYLPLLTLLLPIKADLVAGDARIGVLTVAVVAGALAASGANILFGWLGDRALERGKGRRGGMAAGLIATIAAYALVAFAVTPIALVLAILLFQLAVNALLSPLFALMAEEVPDRDKGVAGGLLSLGNPVASAFSAAIVATWFLNEGARLAAVAVAITACFLPLLLRRASPVVEAPAEAAVRSPGLDRRDLVVALIARLLVQVASSVLFVYLLYYLNGISPGDAPSTVATRAGQVLTIAFVAPLPVAILVGRLSDRIRRRKPFLLGAAIVSAAGLLGMAAADGPMFGATMFGMFVMGHAVFVALHSAFAMQLLPDPRRRGRDLGLLNLANTLPSLLGPPLTWWLASPTDFDAVLMVLAALTVSGGVMMLGVRGRP
ncbi:MFS transporter [Sphingomonas sp. Leaf343]|uniref:MFS transporter n=1 Tax=Sphingomonas sp. Leaf343 TaxID=1736345 RepID=UPI000B04F773|nr:MFS transporter [Sphingomonas sp. Leaf343]